MEQVDVYGGTVEWFNGKLNLVSESGVKGERRDVELPRPQEEPVPSSLNNLFRMSVQMFISESHRNESSLV